MTADLKAEGVNIGTGELGWWLRQKVGLDPLRRQLLDTALQGSEHYGTIESEILNEWSKMNAEDRQLWGEAAVKGWQVYVEQ